MEHLARVSFRIVGKREDNPTNTIEITKRQKLATQYGTCVILDLGGNGSVCGSLSLLRCWV